VHLALDVLKNSAKGDILLEQLSLNGNGKPILITQIVLCSVLAGGGLVYFAMAY
jgi:hypothetical protein